MSNQIYILYPKKLANFKLGSTCNFRVRVFSYITCSDDFDNSSHYIRLYKIINSKYNCYQIDDLINKLSSKHSIPFTKYNGTGGTEFYKYLSQDDFNSLNLFFDKIGIIYTWEEIDVDLLRNETIGFTKKEIRDVEDTDDKLSKSISPEELEKIENIIKPKISIQLKAYQTEIRNKIALNNSRLEHLVISPTGTGKTVIFSIGLSDNIIKNSKDVIILTKKKEILSQLPERIDWYINAFINSGLVKKFNYSITDCLSSCTTLILNEKKSVPQIYIVNWDKLTSSSNTDYKQVDWDKFGLVIIDESQWVGAPRIFEIMTYLKDKKPLVNYLGFSATPIRCNPSNQDNTLKIFGNKQDFNILYEYSYYNALVNKDICPIKYCPIEISFDDLVEEIVKPNNIVEDLVKPDELADEDDPVQTNNKVLSEKSFEKVWKEINSKIISKTYFKKGIFWFRTRVEMMKYYCQMKSVIKDFKLIPTMSITSKESEELSELIKISELTSEDFDSGIGKFLKLGSNAILLAIGRASEGFDDDKLEFGVRMYYSTQVDPLNESQRMGRFNRWYQNNSVGLKTQGYYASLELSDNTESIRKSLISRFKSWIAFAKTYSNTNGSNEEKNGNKNIEQKQKEIIELIHMYVNIDTLKIYEIDIKKDIIDALTNKSFDKYQIRNALRRENQKRSEKDKINIKSKYDIWAIQNDFPICDELEEYGFSDYKFLFDLNEDKYLSWSDLKKLCKEYQNKHGDLKISEIYNKMIEENQNVPIEPEEIYKKNFTNLNDLFN